MVEKEVVVKTGQKKTAEKRKTNIPKDAPVEIPVVEIPTEKLVNELVVELKKAEEKTELDTLKKSNSPPTQPPTDTEKKRSELIKLSEDGEVTQSVSYIKKASVKVVDRLYAEYEARRMERANEFLTDTLISRFSNVLGGLDAIESSEELDNELQKGKLLKSDVGKIVAIITPYLPCLGLLSGGVTVGKHVYHHKKQKVVEQKTRKI